MARLSLPRRRRRQTPSELDLLLETLTDRISHASRGWAATSETLDAIAALGAPGIDVLTATLSSPDRRLRSVVAEYLQALKDPRTLGSLIVALRAAHSGVRAAAATAIAHLPDPRAADALATALDDASPDVR